MPKDPERSKSLTFSRILSRLKSVWGISLILLLFFCPLLAQEAPEQSPVIRLDSHSAEKIQLKGEISFFKDSSGDATWEEISNGDFDDKFKKHAERVPGFGYDASPYWFKISVEVEEPLSSERFLILEYPHIDYVDLYWKDAKGQEGEFHTGDMLPFKERPVADRYFVFPLPLEDKGKIDIFLRAKSDGSLSIPLSLVTKGFLESSSRMSLMLNGIYFGALGVMIFYNFFLFLGIREKTYIYYVILIFSVTYFTIMTSGYGFWFLLPNSPKFINASFLLSTCVAMVFLGLFAEEYLQTKNSHPNLHKAVRGFSYLWGIFLILTPFLPAQFVFPTSAILPIFEIVLLIVISILQSVRRDRKARIFLSAWVLSLIGIVIFSLNKLGFYDSDAIASGTLKLGILSNVILLSLGLVDRINTFRKEKEEYKEKADKLLELSLLDPLTGVANRRFFDQELEREWNRSVRTERPLSLLMIDVDFFKAYNDTYGHLKGDHVLEQVAQSLKDCLNRSSDMIARYGGEEFGVILPDTPVEGAIVVALNMLQTVEDMGIPHSKSTFTRVTVSIGVSTNTDRDIHSYQELLGLADKNLYDAKAFGRNHIRH
ncbi:diguanylate cyclase [Leptospira langatensis]|uniref:diguanylate cyclase n=1 Tax=Leptospira langatensis TaxID=2484983 RepID=A0A5F1ZSF8_9LEPT|nr:diguanylate cyclase [Leptospira langatensis]TGK01840.1 diguanylate cyclase [Leptospira langatensis]TGL39445.1 diguanylate cyclase [Leptospira langatensis]